MLSLYLAGVLVAWSRKSLIVWMQNTSLSAFRKHLFSEHD